MGRGNNAIKERVMRTTADIIYSYLSGVQSDLYQNSLNDVSDDMVEHSAACTETHVVNQINFTWLDTIPQLKKEIIYAKDRE